MIKHTFSVFISVFLISLKFFLHYLDFTLSLHFIFLSANNMRMVMLN